MSHWPSDRAALLHREDRLHFYLRTHDGAMRHIVNLAYGSKVQKSERLGRQGVYFFERL